MVLRQCSFSRRSRNAVRKVDKPRSDEFILTLYSAGATMREVSIVYDGVLDLRSMHSLKYTSIAKSWVEERPNGVHQKVY